MKTLSSLKRAALTAVALTILAGSTGILAAEAAGRRGSDKGRGQRQERTVRQQKPDRARQNDRAVRNSDRRDRRDDRAVRNRDDRRDQDRDRIVIRDRDRDHGDRDYGDRDYGDRVVVRHRSYPVQHRDLRACPPPRYVARPWYREARRIYVRDDPFYFNAGLNVFLGGLALRLELGDVPPAGFVYYDPYCDEEFWSVSDYQYHLRRHRHQPVLTVIVLDGYYLDD